MKIIPTISALLTIVATTGGCYQSKPIDLALMSEQHDVVPRIYIENAKKFDCNEISCARFSFELVIVNESGEDLCISRNIISDDRFHYTLATQSDRGRRSEIYVMDGPDDPPVAVNIGSAESHRISFSNHSLPMARVPVGNADLTVRFDTYNCETNELMRFVYVVGKTEQMP